MTLTLPKGVELASGERLIALVRHGRTAWNAERRFLGRSDVPLDEVGRAEVEALRQVGFGRFEVVFSSPLARAWETALALSPSPEPVPGLIELDQGELEGLDGATAFPRFAEFFQAWQADPAGVPCPGGEAVSACFGRAKLAIAERVEAVPGAVTPAFVTHQVVIGALCAWASGESEGEWRRFAVPNASVTWLAWGPARPRVVLAGWRPEG